MRKFIGILSIALISAGWASAPAAAAVIPGGTPFTVRINENLDTRSHESGDPFTAVLVEPIRVNGNIFVPAGTPFFGHITNAKSSGRLKGRAALGLMLDSFELNGMQYPIATNNPQQVSKSHKGRNRALIGGGAAAGALVGALTGGLGGAALGGIVGGGGGTAGAALTGKKHATVSSESLVTFQLAAPLRM